MRILAVSDIHNNVAAVRKMRHQESNDFDAIVVAGDIGSYRATEIFDTLRSFGCPIVYVYGNWDRQFPHESDFGPLAHLIHFNVFDLGLISFTGFSEFPRGNDPIIRDISDDVSGAEHMHIYREALVELIVKSRLDVRRTVIVTHERLTRLGQRLPGVSLCLFGHIHTHDVTTSKGTAYVNVSALDRILAVVPSSGRSRGWANAPASHAARWDFLGDLRHVNAGNYIVISIRRSLDIDVECRFLHHHYDDWKVVGRGEWFGAPLVPEEESFGDNIRFVSE